MLSISVHKVGVGAKMQGQKQANTYIRSVRNMCIALSRHEKARGALYDVENKDLA